MTNGQLKDPEKMSEEELASAIKTGVVPAKAPAKEEPSTPLQSSNGQPAPSKQPGPADGQPDPVEWAKAKGLKTTEEIARSLQNLEREFHSRNQELKKLKEEKETPALPQPKKEVEPVASPPMPVSKNEPQFQTTEQALSYWSERHGMDQDDVKKLAPFMLELITMATSEDKKELKNLRDSFGKKDADVERQQDRMSVLEDNTIKNKAMRLQALNEMHRILEEDKSILERERKPYSYALGKAKVRVAEQYLGGDGVQTNLETLPSSPPPLGGPGGGPGNLTPEQVQITEETFNKLPVEKQKEVLSALGAIKT